jgi:DNA repair photolyase
MSVCIHICIFCYKQSYVRRMESSEMLRRVALVRNNVSEEPSASVIRVKGVEEL